MPDGTVTPDDRARNWSPSMRRAVEAMQRYPLAVCKPARLDTVCKRAGLHTVCAACGCPMNPGDWPEWPDVDLTAEYPL